MALPADQNVEFSGGLVPCANKFFETQQFIYSSLYCTSHKHQNITQVDSINNTDLSAFDESDSDPT